MHLQDHYKLMLVEDWSIICIPFQNPSMMQTYPAICMLRGHSPLYEVPDLGRSTQVQHRQVSREHLRDVTADGRLLPPEV